MVRIDNLFEVLRQAILGFADLLIFGGTVCRGYDILLGKVSTLKAQETYICTYIPVSEVNRVAGLCYFACWFAGVLVCGALVTLLCVTVTSHVSHHSLPGISHRCVDTLALLSMIQIDQA